MLHKNREHKDMTVCRCVLKSNANVAVVHKGMLV